MGDDLKKYTMSTRVWYVINGLTDFERCKNCGKPILRNVARITNPNLGFCSNDCQIHSEQFKTQRVQTWLKNLGVDSPSKNKDVHEKQKRTCMERLGVEYPM